jgi:solute carrier family 25 (mitochondrial carnitine/acylcarnitine transporter), member 20/29
MGIKDFLAGTAGGFCGKFLDYPFDTVKVLMQTENVGSVGTKSNTGALHVIRNVYTENGIRGFYKGISAPLIGSMAENALLFTSYTAFKGVLGYKEGGPDLPWISLATAGAGAGGIVPLVLTPVELIKCRMQVQNARPGQFKAYNNTMDCIAKTIREEGVAKGLYRGNLSTMLREIPGNFCWYGVYEGFCMLNIPDGGTKADVGPLVHLGGGAMAGVAYWTAFYPADTVKSQIQTNPEFADTSFMRTLRSIYANEGLRGLYRGWGITALRAAPAHALIFAVYEQTMKTLNKSF